MIRVARSKIGPYTFLPSHTQTVKLTKANAKRVTQLYRDLAKEVRNRANNIDPNRNISSQIRQGYLRNLEQDIAFQLHRIGLEVEGISTQSMKDAAGFVLTDHLNWLEHTPFGKFGYAYAAVPDQVVRSLMSGQIYRDGYSLSQALWGSVGKQQKDVYAIVARGLAANRSAYDIAKDLEAYVNPDRRKPWDWNKVYPGSNKTIDYSAQRLVRTLTNHAFQQAFVRTTYANPFVEAYIWHSVFSPRSCQLCQDRDGKKYKKDELPLDHPNGMCYYEAYIPDSMDAVGARLADWANGASDPALDEWQRNLQQGIDMNIPLPRN